MDNKTSILEILDWPVKVVDAIRQVLLTINIQLSGVMAQVLVCVVLILIAYYLFKKGRNAQTAKIRLVTYSVLAATIIGVISIISVWADYVIWPRNKEIIGQVAFSGDKKPSIELLDNLGRELGIKADIDIQGSFFIQFTPVFADPPVTLRIQQTGCKSKEYLIRRGHLLGEIMQITWSCDAL